MQHHFQVVTQCGHCHVEGASVETFAQDAPCCHFGVPLETRCKMCQRATRGGVWAPDGAPPERAAHPLTREACPRCAHPLDDDARSAYRCPACHLGAYAELTSAPVPLTTRAEVEAALTRWAAEEGFDAPQEFLDTSFACGSIDALTTLLRDGAPVTTSMDVLGFLFAHMSGGLSGIQAADAAPPTLGVQRSTTQQLAAVAPRRPPTARIQLPTPLAPTDRRTPYMALASVIAADGRIQPQERAYVDGVLRDAGLDPLRDDELRVRRPHEIGLIGPLTEREQMIERMVDVAYLDGERDATELRLIREFARFWGVDPARVDAWEAAHEARQRRGLAKLTYRVRALLLS